MQGGDETKRSAGREVLQRTAEVWQPYSSEPLSELDAKEIIRNFTSFLDLLAGWECTDMGDKTNESVLGN